MNSHVFIPHFHLTYTAGGMLWCLRRYINPQQPFMCLHPLPTTCPCSRPSLPSLPPQSVPKSTCRDGQLKPSRPLQLFSPSSTARALIPFDMITTTGTSGSSTPEVKPTDHHDSDANPHEPDHECRSEGAKGGRGEKPDGADHGMRVEMRFRHAGTSLDTVADPDEDEEEEVNGSDEH